MVSLFFVLLLFVHLFGHGIKLAVAEAGVEHLISLCPCLSSGIRDICHQA